MKAQQPPRVILGHSKQATGAAIGHACEHSHHDGAEGNHGDLGVDLPIGRLQHDYVCVIIHSRDSWR